MVAGFGTFEVLGMGDVTKVGLTVPRR